MSARIPPGYAEAWLRFNTASDPENMYCALGLQLASGQTGTQTLTNSIDSTATAALDNITSSEHTLGPGHVIYGQDGGDLRIDSTNSPVTGAAGTNALTVNTAVLVRKLTASGGRRGRGRMYLPGAPESVFSTAGNMTTGTQATHQTALDNLMTTLIALAGVDGLCLFHDTAPFTPTPITSLEVQLKAATQRRRMRP